MRITFNTLHRLFFALLLFFLPAQLNYYMWPSWAFVLGRPVDYLALVVYMTDILLVLCVASWLASLHFKYSIHPRMKLYVGVLLLFITINSLLSYSIPLTFYKWITLLKMVMLGVYILHNKINKEQWYLPLLLGGVWVSLLGITQVITTTTQGFYLLGERTFNYSTPGIAKFALCMPEQISSLCINTLRAYGTFPHPNVLGGFLVLVILLLVSERTVLLSILPLQQPLKKIVITLFAIPIVIAFVFSFSRSAWIGLLTGLLFMSSISLHKKILITIAIATIIVFTTIPFPFSFYDNNESFFVRQQLNSSAIQIIESYPLWGVGLGNFLYALPHHLVSRTIYFLQPVHNIYILLISEVGLVGIVVLFVGVYSVFRLNRIAIQKDKLSLIIPFLLIGLADHYVITLHQGQLLLTIVIAFVCDFSPRKT